MTGVRGSAIDFTWLISNLEVQDIEVGSEEKSFATVATFVLGPERVGREKSTCWPYFIYIQQYICTKLLVAQKSCLDDLLRRLEELVKAGNLQATGLPDNHPLIGYLVGRGLDAYLELDDTVVWGALALFAKAPDRSVREDAIRLRDRRLLKAIDVRFLLSDGRLYPGDEVDQRQLAFQRALKTRCDEDPSLVNQILIVDTNVTRTNGRATKARARSNRSTYYLRGTLWIWRPFHQ